MSVIIPQGGTFLDTLRKSFVDVPIIENNGIVTKDFLEAAESLTSLFDLLGSVAFTPVKNDMLGNIKKIRERQLAAPNESGTLQSLVVNELKTKSHKASEGLLWLTRGLDFTAQALRQNVSNPSEELAASFRGAYKNTLAPHHSFMVKPIFSAAMSATPYRKAFYEKMVNDPSEVDKAQKPLQDWLQALETRVEIVKAFQKTKEAQW
ncbi:MAG: hypothetical protein Q9227_009238 [Pyrenula ochraceoflavens]